MLITTGSSRTSTKWKTEEMSWSTLCERLSNVYRTDETQSEYRAMSAEEKGLRKDRGGFVGGALFEDGRRTKNNIKNRTLVTLDADFASKDSWEQATMLLDYAMCCYSTHSHSEKTPRLRYVIPLDRAVSTEEYEPIARRVAADIGIDQFDVTTYETARLFYWPSASSDAPFIFEKQDGPFLSADETLSRYRDWRDVSEWPLGATESAVRTKTARAQGDPTTKPGLVGLFCRAYDIPSAIEKFLPDVYEPCDDPTRYTYSAGSTAAGAILYENGKFLYSHHATDPVSGQLCNAFDLVRIHKFGQLDLNSDKNKITSLPSYKAMCDVVKDDPEAKRLMVEESLEVAKAVFGPADTVVKQEPKPTDDNWVAKLDTDQHGTIAATTNNLVLIFENDPLISGKIALNLFKGIPCVIGDLPWHKCADPLNGDQWEDEDNAALIYYLETSYKIYNTAKMSAALSVVMGMHEFHPVQNYLNGLKWDGVHRAEHLFIDYLGAEDNLYTRTVTRKWLVAAVARAMRPGVKFDNLVVLVGAQGIGKSYLGNLLGRGWFSDTFGTVQGKDAYEQLKGCWIIEIAELSAMKKAEVESVKMFISKQEDNYRGAYREFSKVNKRQCVFYGTTNDDSFLRDRTGNRRFWPIAVNKDDALFDVFSMTDHDIDQIWAEAVELFRRGESLYLDAEVSALAVKEQEKFMTLDPRQGVIEDYLDKLLPANWDSLNKKQRRDFIQGVNFTDGLEGTVLRKEVSVPELAYELFGEETLQPWQAKDYHNILIGLPNWEKTGNRPRSIYGRQIVYERTDTE